MNPGGIVSEEHYEGGIAVVNGHSYHDANLRTENTNFAVLVSTHFTKPFDEPIKYGNGRAGRPFLCAAAPAFDEHHRSAPRL